MIGSIILLIVGLLLVFLEFFLPGGIMGIGGIVVLVIGLIAFGVHSPNPLLTVGVVLLTLLLLFLFVRFALKRLRGSKGEGTFYLHKDQTGYKASAFAKDLIGQEATALTDLRPSGHIRVAGETYQALVKGNYVSRGATLKIVGGEGAHLIVKEVQQKEK